MTAMTEVTHFFPMTFPRAHYCTGDLADTLKKMSVTIPLNLNPFRSGVKAELSKDRGLQHGDRQLILLVARMCASGEPQGFQMRGVVELGRHAAHDDQCNGYLFILLVATQDDWRVTWHMPTNCGTLYYCANAGGTHEGDPRGERLKAGRLSGSEYGPKINSKFWKGHRHAPATLDHFVDWHYQAFAGARLEHDMRKHTQPSS